MPRVRRERVAGRGGATLGDFGTKNRPNFLIIGTAKSGSTALWHYLGQHPQVYMSPRKHTRFFSFQTEDPGFRGPPLEAESVPYAITDVDAYHALFAGAAGEKAVGEASHSYLYRAEAPGRIRKYDPNMKLVAVLRNPAERSHSHYRQMVRDGREELDDFVSALEAEDARIRNHWWPDFHYVQIGLYHAQLKRYFDAFERSQIKIHLYEDLVSEPQAVLRDIFRFLDIDADFVPEIAVRYNASGRPKSKALHYTLQGMRRLRPIAERVLPKHQSRRLLRLGSALHNRNLEKAHLSPEVRRRVTDWYFRDDIVRLQGLIGRDLSAWLG
jgi:hypothetical protein